MTKTKVIKYESPEQVFNEIVEQLKQNGKYQSDFLLRTLLTKNIPVLKRTGNDRDAINKSRIKYGWKVYQSAKAKGEIAYYNDIVDWEAFEIMDEFGIQNSDFIYASTEEECKDKLAYSMGSDSALSRLSENFEPVSIAIYNPLMFRELMHHGYEFLDKTRKGKLEALLGLFKIKDIKTPRETERVA
ncbi:MAG TPA: hypothetical protein VJ438_03880 [Candidatus Nanoarchaeia archaeon]|nr:hypothetical protein [Candidatus Nanoarchaeia archaeon]